MAWWGSQQFQNHDLRMLMAFVLGGAVGWAGVGVYGVTYDWLERRASIGRAVIFHDEPFNVEWWRDVWLKHLRETRSGRTVPPVPATPPSEDSE